MVVMSAYVAEVPPKGDIHAEWAGQLDQPRALPSHAQADIVLQDRHKDARH